MNQTSTNGGPSGLETRTPAVAGTKAGAKECENRETSKNLNSTFHRFDAIARYTVDAWLSVEVLS